MERQRRYDIDWIRVIVFDILILYHVCMFFVEWDWHIKNNELVSWIEYPMKFINQWRIPILFVVSGMGTRFALSYKSGKQYIKERFSRLFIPLLFGILIIVPPQVYLERLAEGETYKSFFNFYPQFFNGIYPTGNLSWHHLWFLPYLLTMSILATPIFIWLRKEDNSIVETIGNVVKKQPFFLYFPVIFLSIAEYSLQSYPITHAFVGDWYCWGMYSLLFVLGFILICLKDIFWENVEKLRLATLFIGCLSYLILIFYAEGKQFNESIYWWIPFVKVVNMWSWILTIFAWSAKYLNRHSELVLYRNKAVYPFYILHQTIIVICGYFLMELPIHYSIKMLIMALVTFFSCWVIYKFAILKTPFLQPLFGVKEKINKS